MYKIIQPPRHLHKYIDFFWFGDDLDLPIKPNTHHAIASSKIELLFFDKGIYSHNRNGIQESVYKAGFYGQTTSFKHYFAVTPRTTIFGVTFSPLAALTLFRIPASQLTHQIIDINSILGSQGNELVDKVSESQTFLEKTKVTVEFFNNRVKELHVKYHAIENLIHSINQINIKSLPKLVCQSHLSQRQFERHFKELAGFSAKTYLKIRRFEQFIERASYINMSEHKLLDIALNLGYYDQAHLNRHFKEFTGLNPRAYFQNSILQQGHTENVDYVQF